MDACSIRPWVIGGVALAIVLLLLWVMRSSHRDVIGKYAKQWGVDAATAAAVRARRESRLNGLLIWLAFSPAFVMIIGVLAFSVGDMVPAFRACTTPFPFFPTSAAILTGFVYCLPLTIAAVALVIFLTPPRLIAYRRALMRLSREDLPEHPTLADFEAALPPLAPESPWTRLVSLAVCAAGIAVVVWLTVNHTPGVIFDFITGHDRASPRMVSFNHGLTTTFRWFPYIVLPIALAQMLFVGWTLMFGNSRALRKLAAKWSLSSAEMRRLFKPMEGGVYRSLSLASWAAVPVGIVGTLVFWLAPPAMRMLDIPMFGALLVSSVVALGLRLVFCARSSLYIRSLSHELQTLSPTAGASAATIVAGLDPKAMDRAVWQIRLLGVFMVAMILFSAWRVFQLPGFIAHLAQIPLAH